MTPCVATRCQTWVLKEDNRKLRHARAAPQMAAVWRLRAQRLVKRAKRKGIDRYMTPLEVVPMIPVTSRFPFKVQLLE